MNQVNRLVFSFLALFSFYVGLCEAAMEVKKAEWDAEKQQLKLKVKADDECANPFLVYQDQSYPLYLEDDEDHDEGTYELELAPICYMPTAEIKTESGCSVMVSVETEHGEPRGFECVSDQEFPFPGHPAGISVKKARWKADRRRLELEVLYERPGASLQVNYGGRSFTLQNVKENRYELKVEQICYDRQLVVTGPSVQNFTIAVTAEGDPGVYLCDSDMQTCPDMDGDGFSAATCGGNDCSDSDPSIYPGAREICGDGVDQDCSGADQPCSSASHASLSYADYPGNCLSCHHEQAVQIHDSTHYRWYGQAPDMVNRPDLMQGKLTNAVNSYCINIRGNWQVCGSCHVGRGLRPDDSSEGLSNIDCLVCHNSQYAAGRKRLDDGTMGVDGPTDELVQAVGPPTRENCLVCHARAGGGDGVKRGDLSMALVSNADRDFDVHMNVKGPDLPCQSCHVFRQHRVIGKGSDLRPTDDPQRGSQVECTSCHADKSRPDGHDDAKIGDHVARVACQTCHIPVYAKVATEVHRDWRRHADGRPADGSGGPGHPYTEKARDLVPEYRWWNRLSDNYLLGDDAARTYDWEKGTYPTSRPMGSVDGADSKLYPFKYKTAVQPKTTNDNRLIALDTYEYLVASGDVTKAVAKGLANMGLSPDTPYEWIVTDTYQMLNHGVSPADSALRCMDCHGSTMRMDLKGELGYALKGPMTTPDGKGVCQQCHGYERPKSFYEMHDEHVDSKGFDCSWCHAFTRAERGLRRP